MLRIYSSQCHRDLYANRRDAPFRVQPILGGFTQMGKRGSRECCKKRRSRSDDASRKYSPRGRHARGLSIPKWSPPFGVDANQRGPAHRTCMYSSAGKHGACNQTERLMKTNHGTTKPVQWSATVVDRSNFLLSDDPQTDVLRTLTASRYASREYLTVSQYCWSSSFT